MTATRVTPSTSWRAARNLATASCPAAQPWIWSDGPSTLSVPRARGRAAAFNRDARRDRGAEAGQPDVVRDHDRQLAQDPLPVEAAPGQGRDRLLTGLLERGELGERRQPLRFGLGLARPATRGSPSRPRARRSGCWPSPAAVTADQCRAQHRDDHVGERAGAHRRPVAAALLGRDQVDGTHALLLQGEAEGKGQPGRRRVVQVGESARRADLEPLSRGRAGGAP